MDVFVGRITSTGFSTGDRIVIGDWRESPLGSFTNIMWAKPDGSRVLLSPSEMHAEYVSELYNFEDVRVTEITVERGKRGISINGGGLDIKIGWGIALPIPFWRPLWFIASFEALFSRILFGTRTHGITKNGRREWYSVRSLSRILKAEASFEGEDLGMKRDFEIDACFGFSEPPSIPASVTLKSYIE
ncbi:MAG: hypothetical protein DWB89_00790 [Candidatus Poseidoniales archaeon]|nr:MAG: hypothetical protein DWB89_00790 [Candidatus Poseidoniales archaeon]